MCSFLRRIRPSASGVKINFDENYDSGLADPDGGLSRVRRRSLAITSETTAPCYHVEGSRLTTTPGPGRPGRDRNFYQNLFLDRNQMGEFVLKNCTRTTDRHKIDFLKIYISRFFQTKTCLGPPQNTPRSSPYDPQKPPKSTQKRSKIDPC